MDDSIVRSRLSYANTLRHSDNMVRQGSEGNMGLVIGKLHRKDFYRIAEEQSFNDTHPAIKLVQPSYCDVNLFRI